MALALAAVTALSGCAALTEVSTTVSSYGQWPEGRKPGKYVFERLPSQQSRAELQDQLEAAAQPALASAGFELTPDAQQADVSVQVGAQLQLDQRPRYVDPFWGPYPYAPMGPWPAPGVGAWWGSGYRGGFALSMAIEPPNVRMRVDVLIRDRHNNQVLYETHAAHDRVGSADPALYPYLFEAALKDFPNQAVSPRAVTVQTKPRAH